MDFTTEKDEKSHRVDAFDAVSRRLEVLGALGTLTSDEKAHRRYAEEAMRLMDAAEWLLTLPIESAGLYSDGEYIKSMSTPELLVEMDRRSRELLEGFMAYKEGQK